MIDPYVYPNTDVIINRFNVRDKKKLHTLEADLTSFRIKSLVESSMIGNFDIQHLYQVHRYIFQDIYDWAGKPRTVDIYKAEPALGGLSIDYAKTGAIEKSISDILKRMNGTDWSSLSLDDKVKQFSSDMAALWQVHPFREGNTRTTVIFCSQFAESRGFRLDTKLFAENSEYVRRSLVAASAKFSDAGDWSKPVYLMRIIRDSIQRGAREAERLQDNTMDINDWQSAIAERRPAAPPKTPTAPERTRSSKDKDDR